MNELVFKSEKGNPVTTSLLVAEKFSKEHKNVLAAIKEIIRSAENSAHLYYLSSYKDSMNRTQEMYIMNRDGFMLLSMGFTGTVALNLKLGFIEAFNKMEQTIKNLVMLPDFNDPVAAARAWADERENRMIAEKSLKLLEPKADFVDRVIESDHLVDIGQAAKLLKLPFGRNIFFRKLKDDGIFFQLRNEPKQQYCSQGYFELKEKKIPRTHHKPLVITKVFVTQKGLYWLSRKYDGSFHQGFPKLNVQ